jgi:Holliday junction resolvase-like predicted endonuclease
MPVQPAVITNTALHVALLHETRQGTVCKRDEVVQTSRVCSSVVKESLETLQEAGALTAVGEAIHVTAEQRLRIAEIAVMNGADPEPVARELSWQEFERFASQVLSLEGYVTANHFVFKNCGRRYEIDVLGSKEPMVLCVDCKHWHYGWAPSKVKAAANSQLLRAQSLSEVFTFYGKKHKIAGWRSVRLLPIVLTLADLSPKLMEGVPVVSAFRLRDFLCQVSPWTERLHFIHVPLSSQALLDS